MVTNVSLRRREILNQQRVTRRIKSDDDSNNEDTILCCTKTGHKEANKWALLKLTNGVKL